MSLHDVIESESKFAQEMKARALKAEQKSDEIIEAARALIAVIDGADLHKCCLCVDVVLATHRCPISGGSYFTCEKHAVKFATVLPIVEPLRRLRALTSEEGTG